MRKRITLTVVVVALFVVLGGLSFAVEMYFDYLWFTELGKTAVFTTSLYAKSLLGSSILLVSFLFLYFNLFFANRGPGLIQIGIPTPAGQITAYTVQPKWFESCPVCWPCSWDCLWESGVQQLGKCLALDAPGPI